jgi:hypothetical protein
MTNVKRGRWVFLWALGAGGVLSAGCDSVLGIGAPVHGTGGASGTGGTSATSTSQGSGGAGGLASGSSSAASSGGSSSTSAGSSGETTSSSSSGKASSSSSSSTSTGGLPCGGSCQALHCCCVPEGTCALLDLCKAPNMCLMPPKDAGAD